MKNKLKLVLIILLSLSLIAVGASFLREDEPITIVKQNENAFYDVEFWKDPELGINILAEPNVFPSLWGSYDATVAGELTFTGAVVGMAGGRVNILEETTVAELGTSTLHKLPAGETFECCLAAGMGLPGGYTYYGYYRSADGPFKRLSAQTAMAPITLVVTENGDDGYVTGSLGTGLTVTGDTKATLSLRNCMNGTTPYYEVGQYQFYIVAIPN